MARLTQDNPDRNQQAVIAEALFQIVIDVLVIALQFGVMEQARLASNMETMRELVHTQRVQYEASKESAQLINEKYHDLRQYRTNELVRWRMHFLSDAIAEIEGLLEVNRDFCKKQMAEIQPFACCRIIQRFPR